MELRYDAIDDDEGRQPGDPIVEHLVDEEPVTEEALTEEPVAEEPASEEPVAEPASVEPQRPVSPNAELPT